MISESLQIPTVSPGLVLREEAKAGTALGRQAAEYTSRGRLAPDAVVVGVVESWLEHHNGRFAFDGFPRSMSQAKSLECILERRDSTLEAALFLDAPEETIRERVRRRRVCEDCGKTVSLGLHVAEDASECPRCGGILALRKDDSLETLEERLKEYRDMTAPLIPFYENAGLLKRIDSARKPEQVFAAICRELK